MDTILVRDNLSGRWIDEQEASVVFSQFKREAVRLVAAQGLTVVQVAADLGVSRNTLYGWVRSLQDEAAPNGVERAMSTEEELRLLRKEVARLKLERDISKRVPGAALARRRLRGLVALAEVSHEVRDKVPEAAVVAPRNQLGGRGVLRERVRRLSLGVDYV